MKVIDLAALTAFALLAGGAGGAFVYWQAEDARYESGLDAMVDRMFAAVEFDTLGPALAEHGEQRLDALRLLYDDRRQSYRLNRGFGAVRAEWETSYPLYAEQAGQEVEDGRLKSEMDERLGEGVYALMEQRYAEYAGYDGQRRRWERPRGQERVLTRRECEREARELGVIVTCNTAEGAISVDGRRQGGFESN